MKGYAQTIAIALLIVTNVWCICFVDSYKDIQDANELIRAGFTIIDPEGYEVEYFENGYHSKYEPRTT